MPVNQPILKNKEADRQLFEEGYTIITFLNKTEIIDLSTFFYSKHNTLPSGLYATAHLQDIAFRNEMNDKINTTFHRANEANFNQARALGGTFMLKSPGKEGLLNPHQDWSIVDEDEWRSFNVWVPLVDVNESNGTIEIIEKSHLSHKTYRGINIPQDEKGLNIAKWDSMKVMCMKAGDALIYDHRLWHASKENLSSNNRLVVVYGIIPQQAEMRYYFQENNKIIEYACTPDFFLNGNPAEGPKNLSKIREITAYTKDNFKKEEKTSIFKKIKNWFK